MKQVIIVVSSSWRNPLPELPCLRCPLFPHCRTRMLRLPSKYERRSRHFPDRRADRRSRPRQHADRADGRAGADGERACGRGGRHAADRQRPSFPAGGRRAYRPAQAGPAPLFRARQRRGGAAAREHHGLCGEPRADAQPSRPEGSGAAQGARLLQPPCRRFRRAHARPAGGRRRRGTRRRGGIADAFRRDAHRRHRHRPCRAEDPAPPRLPHLPRLERAALAPRRLAWRGAARPVHRRRLGEAREGQPRHPLHRRGRAAVPGALSGVTAAPYPAAATFFPQAGRRGLGRRLPQTKTADWREGEAAYAFAPLAGRRSRQRDEGPLHHPAPQAAA
nr:hypothetical protein SHINE37_40322 [Rhizobiaceae bacterium]